MKPRRGYGNTTKTRMRSGLEVKVKEDLEKKGILYEYENLKLSYTKDTCKNCGATVKSGIYTPDFIIPRTSGKRLVVESKGRFTSVDRTKMQRVKRDNPTEDIRLLFQRDQFIRAGSSTRYSDWAVKNGFLYAIGETVPKEWLKDALRK